MHWFKSNKTASARCSHFLLPSTERALSGDLVVPASEGLCRHVVLKCLALL